MKKTISIALLALTGLVGCVKDRAEYICAVEDPDHSGKYIQIECPSDFVPPDAGKAQDKLTCGNDCA